MGRRLKIDRPRRVEALIPESIWTKVEEQLWSEIEGRVPYGAHSALLTQLVSGWLRERGVMI